MAALRPENRLRQTKMRKQLRRNGGGGWTVGRSGRGEEKSNSTKFAAISDAGRKNGALRDASWDLPIGRLRPVVLNSEVSDGDE